MSYYERKFFDEIMLLMKRMNKMLLVAALAATTLSVQAEQKKGPAWLSDALFYAACDGSSCTDAAAFSCQAAASGYYRFGKLLEWYLERNLL